MRRLALIVTCFVSIAASPSGAQSPGAGSAPPEQRELIHSSEQFIRNLFTWGPEYKLKLGPLASSADPDFYSLPIEVTYKGQSESATFYVSKDGKTFIRGEMFTMSADPFAATRAKLDIDGNPSKGPANARITVVEFADFECPHCRELHTILKSVEEHYPQVRFVYKDFPISQLHPWAETAAIGARCAFRQSPDAFWKMHDLIFDNQEAISPENVFDQLVGFAGQIGLNSDSFKTCLSSPEAKQAVDANHADGVALNINNTPTLFINGRMLVGGDLASIEGYIDFAAAPK
ncbi:MAG TPA: thioredoxin domain-containing protein [Candidatus Cybelea sp.]|nr:thioredoxin domain-containing protein [Candidatus Cybelea sp.]